MKNKAHQTRQAILTAATDLFVEKGFSGTSISDIAHKAGIHQSLIYHHIGNKESLWKEVKKHLIPENIDFQIQEIPQNFTDFLGVILHQRIALYESDPRIVRLMQWQSLEDNQDIRGGTSMSPSQWVEIIQALQAKGCMTTQYDATFIVFFIHSLTQGLINDPLRVLAGIPKRKQEYVQKIQDELVRMFG